MPAPGPTSDTSDTATATEETLRREAERILLSSAARLIGVLHRVAGETGLALGFAFRDIVLDREMPPTSRPLADVLDLLASHAAPRRPRGSVTRAPLQPVAPPRHAGSGRSPREIVVCPLLDGSTNQSPSSSKGINMTTSATSPSGACSTEPIVRSRAIRLLHASGPRLIDLLLDRRYIAGQAHPDAFSESLQRRMRDECLNGNLVFSINHARAIVAGWVETFNTGRPHSAIGYMTPKACAATLKPQRALALRRLESSGACCPDSRTRAARLTGN